MNIKAIHDYINNQPVKAVEMIDVEKKKIRYSSSIKSARDIKEISGDEEIVRAVILTKLANEYGYPLERIELEKTYEIGRPKVIYPRIDVIVKDKNNKSFLFIELKSPDKFEEEQDEAIEKQLFNLSREEIGNKYLVLLTCDLDDSFGNKAIVIDNEKYKSYKDWKDDRFFTDEIPTRYGKSVKKPYVKGSEKDLDKCYSETVFSSIQTNLHNVLWGGGGTDDNDVFSSLVNIILAKIQDESEKNDGETYDFQSFAYTKNEDEKYETNEDLYDRMNLLYRRALKERMYITNDDELNESFIIDKKKFSLSKLKYAVISLERYSLVDGKNSFSGKDILGNFFEGIIRNGFKQSKGQFFTHTNIVRFILWGLKLDELAIERINRDKVIPYLIDPSAGSGTFLIEYMRFITENIKYRFRDRLSKNRDVCDKIESDWFYPDYRENKWAREYIYGIEHNFNLGTASKVNMILHGDGSTNVFVKDGLLPFNKYTKDTEPNVLHNSSVDKLYDDYIINGQFDVVVSNPPFSVELDNDTKETLDESFLFSKKKNSENLFIERYYQLLREGGRMGIVLPESVLDTSENKYIRLFLFKYFKVKAIISLPQVTFAPYTPTKTSIVFAQKKKASDIVEWEDSWKKYTNEYGKLRTRCINLFKVYIENKNRNKYKSISELNELEEKDLIFKLLRNLLCDEDRGLAIKELVAKYKTEIDSICKIDKDISKTFGMVNTWWVFGEVSKDLDYNIMMLEVNSVGYKRTKRSERKQPNELFRTDTQNAIIVNDSIKETALDYVRDIDWD